MDCIIVAVVSSTLGFFIGSFIRGCGVQNDRHDFIMRNKYLENENKHLSDKIRFYDKKQLTK